MRGQPFKAPRFDPVFLGIVDTRFHLTLMAWHSRFCGHNDCAVMLAKRNNLGSQFGIKPISLGDCGTQVINNKCLGNAAKIAEAVFQAADKIFGGLTPNDFAVSLAGITQDDAKQMRPFELAILIDDPGSLAKIHLCLFSWLAFHAPEGQLWKSAAEPQHKTAHRVVTAFKLVLQNQILVNALNR